MFPVLRRWVQLDSRVSAQVGLVESCIPARVGLVEQPCSCMGGSGRAAVSWMATLFGSISEFDASQEDWMQYAECLAHFFTANQITNQDRKKALLLTMISLMAFKLLQSLISPVKSNTKSCEQLVKAMKRHHKPTPSEIMQRYCFNSHFRKEGKSVAKYLAELRALAEFCNYGAIWRMLRD